MTGAQRLEQRIVAESYSRGGQSSRIRDGAGQQANTVDQHQLAILPGSEGKAEHAAKVFDAYHIGREDIRHTNRIDEFGTHELPPAGLMPDRAECKQIDVSAMVHNLKNESKQAVSVSFPPVSTGVVDRPFRLVPRFEQVASA